MRNGLRSWLFLLLLAALPASAQQLDISLGNLDHPAFNVREVHIAFDAFHAGQADITVAELRLGDTQLRDLKFHCKTFQLDETALHCGEGTLQHGQLAPLSLTFDYRFASNKLALTLRNFDLAAWSADIKPLQAWHPVGHLDITMTADAEQAKVDITTHDAGFNTDDYSTAGEKIAATVSLTALRKGSDWHWQALANWSDGEAFWSPWYRKGGVRLTAQGSMTPTLIQLEQGRLTLDRLGSLTAGMTWNRKTASVTRWGFVTDPLDLSVAVKEWVQPVLDAHALPAIMATGTTRYAAEWADGRLQSFYAGIENATFKENTGRLLLTGVNASVPWSYNSETEAEVSVGGGKLDDFTLGGFTVPVRMHGADVAISKVVIPFLDGRVLIDDFHALGPNDIWTGSFSGGIEAVSMPRLTAAMGLPPMVGSLNMRIPAAEYADHVLNLNGDMTIDVFDGHVVARHLKLIDPLSKSSRFVTDVEARRLDLGLLTSAFSFGSILGRLDIDIQGLELQDWKPLAFKAHLANSPGDYRRAISRGALIDISALGGAAGAAAVRAIPTAGFFNTFSYDRIGFGCMLKDGVCHMDGIAPENDGYVLVEGSGIPAIKVMGYNRSIDWNLLVSRIKAVIAGNTKAVIE